MTDNQLREIMGKLTKCVIGIQRIEEEQKIMKGDIVEMKGDIVELKTGQKNIEKKLEIITESLVETAGKNVQIRARVSILEERVL